MVTLKILSFPVPSVSLPASHIEAAIWETSWQLLRALINCLWLGYFGFPTTIYAGTAQLSIEGGALFQLNLTGTSIKCMLGLCTPEGLIQSETH